MTSKRLSVTLAELETHWSIEDAADAHEALDAIEAAEAAAMAEAEARRR